jgi:hypothetical protein
MATSRAACVSGLPVPRSDARLSFAGSALVPQFSWLSTTHSSHRTASLLGALVLNLLDPMRERGVHFYRLRCFKANQTKRWR